MHLWKHVAVWATVWFGCVAEAEPELDTDVEARIAQRLSGRSSTAQRGPIPPGNGRIAGTITDEDSGLPIANVGVEVTYLGTAYTFLSTSTDDQGQYSFDNLGPGYYFVRTKGEVLGQVDYVPEIYPDLSCNLDCDNADEVGQVFIIIDDEEHDAVDLALQPGASISGVLNTTMDYPLLVGLPIVYGIDLVAVQYSVSIEGEAELSLAYHVGGLPPGDYYLGIRALPPSFSNYVFVPRSLSGNDCGLGYCMGPADQITLTAGQQMSDVDLDLTTQFGGEFANVSYADGAINTGEFVSMVLLNGAGQTVGFLSDDFDGATVSLSARYGFRFTPPVYALVRNPSLGDGLPYSTYQDQVYEGMDCGRGPCPVAGATPFTSGIEMVLTPSGSINGTVTDLRMGGFTTGIDVEIYDGAGNLVSVGSTFSDGRYQAGGLPDGTYYARTRNNLRLGDRVWGGGFCANGCDPSRGQPIAVSSAGDVFNIDFVLDDREIVFIGGFE